MHKEQKGMTILICLVFIQGGDLFDVSVALVPFLGEIVCKELKVSRIIHPERFAVGAIYNDFHSVTHNLVDRLLLEQAYSGMQLVRWKVSESMCAGYCAKKNRDHVLLW
jgi:predicted phosphoribosyltransferase